MSIVESQIAFLRCSLCNPQTATILTTIAFLLTIVSIPTPLAFSLLPPSAVPSTLAATRPSGDWKDVGADVWEIHFSSLVL